MLTLNKEEREKFAAWLEHEAHVDFKLIEQMEKINVPSFVLNKRLEVANSCTTVAKMLRSVDDQVL